MRHRIHRIVILAVMLAVALSSVSQPAFAYTAWRFNSFTLYNEADASIVEVYIYPSSSGRGQPRNYSWIHSGSSTVINFSDSDLNSRASWSMSVGFRSGNGVYTVYWDDLSPVELVNAKNVTIRINSQGTYILDYTQPNANSNANSMPMPPSILECIEAGRLEVDASSWFRGNNPSVHPSKMMDGNIMTSWDSDNESHPDFWFTTADGNEYTVTGIRIVNGKSNQNYYRNGRVAKLDMYVNGEYVATLSVNDQKGVYQTIWFDVPVYGSEFFFHVSYIYTSEHETREDLCISEFELF